MFWIVVVDDDDDDDDEEEEDDEEDNDEFSPSSVVVVVVVVVLTTLSKYLVTFISPFLQVNDLSPKFLILSPSISFVCSIKFLINNT